MNRETLATLRDLMPARALSQVEALRIAELQARRLLSLNGIKSAPVPLSVITNVPKIAVRNIMPWPVSGATHWTKGTWTIVIRGNESRGRRRMTLAHEFKHIVDYRHIDIAYPPLYGMTRHDRIEAVCDYFAGCLLVPRPWLKTAWDGGTKTLTALAQIFEVTPAAIRTRLLQSGLVQGGHDWRAEYRFDPFIFSRQVRDRSIEESDSEERANPENIDAAA